MGKGGGSGFPGTLLVNSFQYPQVLEVLEVSFLAKVQTSLGLQIQVDLSKNNFGEFLLLSKSWKIPGFVPN